MYASFFRRAQARQRGRKRALSRRAISSRLSIIERLEERSLLAGDSSLGLTAGLVDQIYFDLLDRTADPVGRAYWTNFLQSGGGRAAVAQGIEGTPEYFSTEVQAAFQFVLGRSADPAADSYFTGVLEQGGTLIQVEADLFASNEYFTAHGGTNDGFLVGLYQDALGRSIDGSGAAYFSSQLADGTSREQVASTILNTLEAKELQVNLIYRQILGRDGDPGGLAYWGGQWQQGLPPDNISADLIASGEYFNANQYFLNRIYEDLFQRPVDAGGLGYWSSFLESGNTRGDFVQVVQASTEYRTDVVQRFYNSLTGQNTDAATLAADLTTLQNGGSIEQIAAEIAGAESYYQAHGGTTDGLLQGLAHDMLNEALTTSQMTAIEQTLPSGFSPTQAAAAFFSSNVYEQSVVESDFQTFLHRSPDAGALAYFVKLLQNGTHDDAVLNVIAASDEYLENSGHGTTLGQISANPGDALVVHSTGLDPTQPTYVVFTDAAGNQTRVRSSVVTTTTATVAAPTILNVAAGVYGPATVSVSIEQDTVSGITITAPSANFQIGDLVQTGVAAGRVTLDMLTQLQNMAAGTAQNWLAIQNASNGSVNSQPLRDLLTTTQSQLAAMYANVLQLVNGAVSQISVGQANGQPVYLDLNGLATIDRMIDSFYLGGISLAGTGLPALPGFLKPGPILPVHPRPVASTSDDPVADQFNSSIGNVFQNVLGRTKKWLDYGEVSASLLDALGYISIPKVAIAGAELGLPVFYLTTVIPIAVDGIVQTMAAPFIELELGPGSAPAFKDYKHDLDSLAQGGLMFVGDEVVGHLVSDILPKALNADPTAIKYLQKVTDVGIPALHLTDPDESGSETQDAFSSSQTIFGAIVPRPSVQLSTHELDFTMTQGAGNPGSDTVIVSNVGPVNSQYEFATPIGTSAPFGLRVSGPLTPIPGGQSNSYDVSVDGGELGPGTYTGSFSFIGVNASVIAPLETVTVKLIVKPQPVTNPFAGSYTGSYTGSGTAFGMTSPANGSVAFTVDANGQINVTSPGGGQGSVSASGQSTIAGAGGVGGVDNSDYTFTGTFVLVSGGGASVSGGWTATFAGGGGSGTWEASRS